MTKGQNEGTTPTANTAASTTEQGNAVAEQAAPTTQASSQAEPTATNTPSAPTEPKTDTAQQSTTEPSTTRASVTPPPLPKQVAASSEAPQTADDLKAQLASLQARLDAIESQRTTETRTAEVERIIAPLSETLKAVYRRTPFATLTDEEYTKLTETIKKEVTELSTADKARGAVFGRPTASTTRFNSRSPSDFNLG